MCQNRGSLQILNDTAPPIRAAYPPFAVSRKSYVAARRATPRVVHLGDIDETFNINSSAKDGRQKIDHELREMVSKEVERVFDDAKMLEIIGESQASLDTSGTSQELDSAERSIEDALDNLTLDLQSRLAEYYNHPLSPMPQKAF